MLASFPDQVLAPARSQPTTENADSETKRPEKKSLESQPANRLYLVGEAEQRLLATIRGIPGQASEHLGQATGRSGVEML